LLPSQRARKNPLCLMVSTAGTQESKALSRWRDQGLRAIDAAKQTSLYFAEFSPPPGVDPMTPAAWEYANPALAGGLIDLDVIQGEALRAEPFSVLKCIGQFVAGRVNRLARTGRV
jgi:hypothetical protein